MCSALKRCCSFESGRQDNATSYVLANRSAETVILNEIQAGPVPPFAGL